MPSIGAGVRVMSLRVAAVEGDLERGATSVVQVVFAPVFLAADRWRAGPAGKSSACSLTSHIVRFGSAKSSTGASASW
jgi:hypothetical protein